MESKILDEIKEYMKKRHITCAELARRSGLSRQLIWYYLKGKNNDGSNEDIKVGNLEKICHALGFSLQIRLIPENKK